jgi:hypothetical protein
MVLGLSAGQSGVSIGNEVVDVPGATASSVTKDQTPHGVQAVRRLARASELCVRG